MCIREEKKEWENEMKDALFSNNTLYLEAG